jgi:hypothetical protein
MSFLIDLFEFTGTSLFSIYDVISGTRRTAQPRRARVKLPLIF